MLESVPLPYAAVWFASMAHAQNWLNSNLFPYPQIFWQMHPVKHGAAVVCMAHKVRTKWWLYIIPTWYIHTTQMRGVDRRLAWENRETRVHTVHDLSVFTYIRLCYAPSTLRGSAVERRSMTGELSLSCARPAADGWPLMWVNRPL